MYYRILEEDGKLYSPFGYNSSSQKEFKKDVEHLLTESLSYMDVVQTLELKWDVFKKKMKSYGFIIQESVTTFEPIDTDDWSFDDDDVFDYEDNY
jgi:hypothetical protein